MNRSTFLLLCFLCGGGVAVQAQEAQDSSFVHFQALLQLPWQSLMEDDGTKDWQEQWTLDGEWARITHSEKGMDFWAGTERRNDAHHAVLWTRQNFQGSIRLEYTYTKLDERKEAVTILYLLATGSGDEGYPEDISLWTDTRKVPKMSTYFLNMHTLHISYAAYPLEKEGEVHAEEDYIRARRYRPDLPVRLKGTDLPPDYLNTGLFETGVPHHITVIKHEQDLFFFIRNEQTSYLCHWKLDQVPPITRGRIGLRHMWTRGARYRDVRVMGL